MAETVVSMARSMLGGAISKAASAAAAELSLVMGVQNDIWYVRIACSYSLINLFKAIHQLTNTSSRKYVRIYHACFKPHFLFFDFVPSIMDVAN